MEEDQMAEIVDKNIFTFYFHRQSDYGSGRDW